MRGGKDRYLNNVFPLLQTLEPRRQREVERFVTSYPLEVNGSLEVTGWKRRKKKKFRWTGYRTYPERADDGRTGAGP